MWAQLLFHFRNVIEGVACVETSVLLRNAIKIPCLQKVVYTYISLSFSAVVALAVSLSRHQNGKNCDASEEERAKRLAQKRKRRQTA